MALFNSKKDNNNELEFNSKIDCIIDSDTTFSGELESTGSMIINGILKGNKLIAKGSLTIGETGAVDADIETHDIKIAGIVNGNINAKAKIEITQQGRLYGDIRSQRLQIIDGGIFEGTCAMGVVKEEIKPALLMEKI
ncbi:MAG: polymer-forming cytoskeletal protein [Candidatus Firestonebacteria bacterium]|nr:polymer-forming cytoskeletal protein [Candidatus Firestonebacteria bacterium]